MKNIPTLKEIVYDSAHGHVCVLFPRVFRFQCPRCCFLANLSKPQKSIGIIDYGSNRKATKFATCSESPQLKRQSIILNLISSEPVPYFTTWQIPQIRNSFSLPFVALPSIAHLAWSNLRITRILPYGIQPRNHKIHDKCLAYPTKDASQMIPRQLHESSHFCSLIAR
jgi:hypothetical protein